MPVFTFPSMSTPGGRYADLSAYPTTEIGWADRYDRLWGAYLGEQYDLSEIKAFHLFRALDEQNNEIDVAKRVTTLYKFIVDTDVGGVLGGKLTLEVEQGEGDESLDEARAALLVEGEAVWARSKVHERVESWVRSIAALGDYYIEAVRTSASKPYKTTLVGYDPRDVTPIYDQETGTQLLKVIVTTGYRDEPTVASDGTVNEGATHTYRREVDANEIRVFLDGQPVESASGPHGLGVIPAVHVQWTPFCLPDHGLPAPVGLDQAVMAIDSMITQSKAIYNRHANPIGVIKGAKAEEGAGLTKFGRFISGLPADGEISYLEAGGAMVGEITKSVEVLLAMVQSTEPEFLFADSGNVSGEARSYKAAAFENKIGNARSRIFSALARVTAYAVWLDRNEEINPDMIPFEVDGPPILPRNIKSELDMINSVKGSLTPGDYVRHLQRLGIVSSHVDPEEYAGKVAQNLP